MAVVLNRNHSEVQRLICITKSAAAALLTALVVLFCHSLSRQVAHTISSDDRIISSVLSGADTSGSTKHRPMHHPVLHGVEISVSFRLSSITKPRITLMAPEN
jgi:hypothetical protein